MSDSVTAISSKVNKISYFIECTLNSNFSANHEVNESDQDNENHPDNINEGNYPANKYTLKVNNR